MENGNWIHGEHTSVFPVQELILKGKEGTFAFQKLTFLSFRSYQMWDSPEVLSVKPAGTCWDVCKSRTSQLFAYLEPSASSVNFLSLDFSIVSGQLLWATASSSGTFSSWKPDLINMVKTPQACSHLSKAMDSKVDELLYRHIYNLNSHGTTLIAHS